MGIENTLALIHPVIQFCFVHFKRTEHQHTPYLVESYVQ